jgi:hypothetical protein
VAYIDLSAKLVQELVIVAGSCIRLQGVSETAVSSCILNFNNEKRVSSYVD